MQRANMDIQLNFNPVACCSYIINYTSINKSQRDVSKIMREAANDIRRGNSSICQNAKSCSGGRILLSGIGVVRN